MSANKKRRMAAMKAARAEEDAQSRLAALKAQQDTELTKLEESMQAISRGSG